MQQLRTLTLSFALLASVSACAATDAAKEAALDSRFKSSKEVQKSLEKVGPQDMPSVNEALLKSARDAEKSGNYANAMNFYAQLLESEPKNKVYILGVADSLRKIGNYTPAIKNYEKLRNEDAEYRAAGLEGIGLSMMAMGEYEPAGDKFSEAMDIDATRWRTVNAIGILFTIREMYDEARQYFDEALTLNADSVSVLNNRALMEALAKNYDESLRTFRQAAAVAGRDSSELRRVELNEALVYAIKGDTESARRLCAKHLTESQVLNNMGYYAYISDDEKMAKSYLNMALTNSPKYYDKAWKNLNALEKLAGRKASNKSAPQ